MSSAEGSSPNVTELLRLSSDGDRTAQEELFQVVYNELRRIAGLAVRRERSDHTLQPTALVNEVFLRLAGNRIEWTSRTHFYSVAARMMRRVLIDYARSAGAIKRSCGKRADLDEALLFTEERFPELIHLDQAMTQLEASHPRACRLVELQFFTGLTPAESAQVLGVSVKTVRRDWKLARAWLHAELAGE